MIIQNIDEREDIREYLKRLNDVRENLNEQKSIIEDAIDEIDHVSYNINEALNQMVINEVNYERVELLDRIPPLVAIVSLTVLITMFLTGLVGL